MTPLHRALVTGATGLLGSNIVAQLLDQGSEVVALVRDEERAERLLGAQPGLLLVTGDVTVPDSYRAALAGVDAVFHTAAYFREYYQPGADPELLTRTNVQAVTDLLAEAKDAGVPVVVHTSTIGTLGTPPPGQRSDEDTPPGPQVLSNGYRASKLEAEARVRAACADGALRVPMVLPGWMWGPGDAGPTSAGRLFLAVARGELHAVPRAGNSIVDARDVAAACLRAAAVGESARRYVVAGTWRRLSEVCEGIAAIVGVSPPREVPARAALAAAAALEMQARLRHQPAVATRAGVRVLLENDRIRHSSERAERELGVVFRPLEDTLEDEAHWYREHGMLPQHTMEGRS